MASPGCRIPGFEPPRGARDRTLRTVIPRVGRRLSGRLCNKLGRAHGGGDSVTTSLMIMCARVRAVWQIPPLMNCIMIATAGKTPATLPRHCRAPVPAPTSSVAARTARQDRRSGSGTRRYIRHHRNAIACRATRCRQPQETSTHTHEGGHPCTIGGAPLYTRYSCVSRGACNAHPASSAAGTRAIPPAATRGRQVLGKINLPPQHCSRVTSTRPSQERARARHKLVHARARRFHLSSRTEKEHLRGASPCGLLGFRVGPQRASHGARNYPSRPPRENLVATPRYGRQAGARAVRAHAHWTQEQSPRVFFVGKAAAWHAAHPAARTHS